MKLPHIATPLYHNLIHCNSHPLSLPQKATLTPTVNSYAIRTPLAATSIDCNSHSPQLPHTATLTHHDCYTLQFPHILTPIERNSHTPILLHSATPTHRKSHTTSTVYAEAMPMAMLHPYRAPPHFVCLKKTNRASLFRSF